MIFLIPTHELEIYLPFIFVFLTFGSFTLSATVHRKISSKWKLTPLQNNNLWNGLLVLLGLWTVSIRQWLPVRASSILIGIFAGALVSYLILQLEIRLNRFIGRRTNFKISLKTTSYQASHSAKVNQNAKMSSLLRGKATSGEKKEDYGRMFEEKKAPLFHLTDLVTCAVVEEFLYRGCILALFSTLLPFPLFIFGIGIQSFFFGLIHQYFGWNQCFNKIIMGLLFSVIVLVTQNLWIPLFSHIFFNILARFYTEARTISQKLEVEKP